MYEFQIDFEDSEHGLILQEIECRIDVDETGYMTDTIEIVCSKFERGPGGHQWNRNWISLDKLIAKDRQKFGWIKTEAIEFLEHDEDFQMWLGEAA